MAKATDKKQGEVRPAQQTVQQPLLQQVEQFVNGTSGEVDHSNELCDEELSKLLHGFEDYHTDPRQFIDGRWA